MIDPRRFALVLIAALAAACGATSAPPSSPTAPTPPAVAPISSALSLVPEAAPALEVRRPVAQRRATVRMDDDPFGVATPLVDAIVGGQPVQLIVDTGASHHVIAAWVAREIGAPPPQPAGMAAAHGGASIPYARLDGVSLRISGYGSVEAPQLLVTEVPPDVRRRGIGGVISPQALVTPGRAVLLDLAGGSLSDLPTSAAASWIQAKGLALDELRVCPGAGADALVLRATIDGEEAALQLDTGSSTSSVGLESALGRRLAKRSRGTNTQVTASGLHTVPSVDGALVKFGPFSQQVNLDLVPRTPLRGCGDGFAGMDVLRRCAVLIGRGSAQLSCTPPR
jgi:predicted aspartyl protease